METTLHDGPKLSIAHQILAALKTLSPETLSTPAEIYAQLENPPSPEMGHYAFPCFPLAKKLRKGPPQIAAQLNQALTTEKLESAIASHSAVGPYVNFFLSASALGAQAAQILDGSFFTTPLTTHSERSMVEYSQPNTHKEIHVGHMRNLALGHSLILLNKYCGQEILAVTFPGDVGTHIAKCLWYLKFKNQEPIPETRKGAFLGRMYSKAHNLLEDEKGTEQEEKNRTILTKILKEVMEKKGEYYDLWKETREWSLELMHELYNWVGVKFDHWYFESDVDAASVAFAQKLFKEGVLTQSEGAIGLDLTEENLGFCMLLKTDGNGLYATKDLELARRKLSENAIEKNIYIVDVRQTHHFKQVFAACKRIGLKNADKCFHLAYDFVELPSGAMSSRSGNIVPVQSLIDEMISLIKTQYLNNYTPQWSREEIEQTAHQVALGAINYGMLQIDPQKKIIFDMKEWLRLDGESGPYLQYTRARILSLTQKIETLQAKGSDKDQNQEKDKDKDKDKDKENVKNSSDQINWALLDLPVEKNLLLKMTQFNTVALQACFNYRPSNLCNYLYDLAKLYNQFYAQCPVANASSPELIRARAAVSKACGLVIEKGLALLGIPCPKRM
jgi:arginyl-tRNA synthetase